MRNQNSENLDKAPVHTTGGILAGPCSVWFESMMVLLSFAECCIHFANEKIRRKVCVKLTVCAEKRSLNAVLEFH